MEISHPRRILAVSRPDSGLLELVKALTGSAPSLTTNSIAGTTHNWPIKTNYYSATVPIWLDEILEPEAWSAEFLGPEAREVLTVLGAFIVCFRKPINQDELKEVKKLLESVAQVVKEGCGYSWDGVCLAVAMPQSTTPYLEQSLDEWEELCQDSGFEFIDFESGGRNEFAEPMGIERLKEALETNDWDGIDDVASGIHEDLLEAEDEFNGDISFDTSPAEMEAEMAVMKQAIYHGGGADAEGDENDANNGAEEVEQLQAMMLKMQAVRDIGAGLPEAERKGFAAKAVNKMMKSL